MGITGLLPFLEKATRPANVCEFRGQTVAVDSYCWLHKGATGCAEILARGEDCDFYVTYCLKYVRLIQSYDIKVIMVFDGNHLPAKEITEVKRRESRANARQRGVELLRLGKNDEARNFFRQCVDITPKMALNLIKACRNIGVDCIVAPYESDSQLAYLNQKGIADVIITEDSDLVLFGCKKVLYKFDLNGNGQLVDADKIYLTMTIRPDEFTFDKFRLMCILSGCDYLDSLPGIGLKKALKFIKLTAETNPVKFLDKIPSYLNMRQLQVSDEYKENFMVALATFKHQVVYDPIERKLARLLDPADSDTRPEHCKNAGQFFDSDVAFQVAIGNLNPFNLKRLDNWTPTDVKETSIWSTSYRKRTPLKEKPVVQPKKTISKEQIRKQIQLETNEKESFDNSLAKELEFYSMPVQVNKENVKQEVKKDPLSPPIGKKFSNPFRKAPTMDSNEIVKSRFFERSMSATEVTNRIEDLCMTEDEDESVKRKRLDGHDLTEESEFEEEKTQAHIDLTQDLTRIQEQKPIPRSAPKKIKLVKSKSLGGPPKKQITLNVMFSNMKKK